jgi:dihydroxyacetone kinase phosphoprotein-dependent L subunit
MASNACINPGCEIVLELAQQVIEAKSWLSEIDGAIGDGDHGINMAKGFSMAQDRIRRAGEPDLSLSFKILADTLLDDIGGSMGPLYGAFFNALAKACQGCEELNGDVLERMFTRVLERVGALSKAQVGDKTLIDTLDPAVKAFQQARTAGADLPGMLAALKLAATQGRDSTKDLQARVGRASRLGARSIGTIDAGAASCCLILCNLADSFLRRLTH